MHQSYDHRSSSVSRDQNCLLPVESRMAVAVACLLKAGLKRKASRTGLKSRRPSPASCVLGALLAACFTSSGRVKPNQAFVSHPQKLISPPLTATLTLLTCPSTRAKVTPTNTTTTIYHSEPCQLPSFLLFHFETSHSLPIAIPYPSHLSFAISGSDVHMKHPASCSQFQALARP